MLRYTSILISYLFHPLLMVTCMLALLLLINPYLFGVGDISDKGAKLLLLQVFLSTFFIPAFAVLMLRLVGLLQSLEMPTRQDRIVPYIITGIFYLWLARNFLGNPQIPTAFASFVLGATIALFIAFFINIFSKISAHAVGMGGLVGMVVIAMAYFSYSTFTVHTAAFGVLEVSMSAVLIAAVLLAGMVGTARLVLQAHEPMDLYGGYLVGFIAQLIAHRFLF